MKKIFYFLVLLFLFSCSEDSDENPNPLKTVKVFDYELDVPLSYQISYDTDSGFTSNDYSGKLVDGVYKLNFYYRFIHSTPGFSTYFTEEDYTMIEETRIDHILKILVPNDLTKRRIVFFFYNPEEYDATLDSYFSLYIYADIPNTLEKQQEVIDIFKSIRPY